MVDGNSFLDQPVDQITQHFRSEIEWKERRSIEQGCEYICGRSTEAAWVHKNMSVVSADMIVVGIVHGEMEHIAMVLDCTFWPSG